MKIPLKWINNYIKIKHSEEEFGDILTNLEFMQDGPIINGIIDLEVRQNRPDALSVIGIAREYSAFIDEPIIEPDKFDLEANGINWSKPDEILNIEDKENVQRFTAAEIRNIKISESPDWLKEGLESYGIPSINNVVDITNYVMLEYGIPLHAFDKNKLSEKENHQLLTLRKAEPKEQFTTWQGTVLNLTSQDLVVADGEKPVAIAGIIGGANSDIDNNTTEIILEAACYNHATVRRTAMRHQIRTEASSRHEKFLSPLMVKDAILRAIYLITTLAEGKVIRIEDFAREDVTVQEIEFNVNEISRLGGVTIESEIVANLLTRLGFNILEHKEAIGINRDIYLVQIPKWRTDITHQADIVEEVLRLNGYKNIIPVELTTAPPNFGTPNILLLEDIIKDLLVQCGLYEHVLSPLVKNNGHSKQILIENPLNKDNEALRTTIRETLLPVVEFYKKSGKKSFGLFESGKIYLKLKEGEYTEEKQIEVIYSGLSYENKVKPDFLFVLERLGLDNQEVYWEVEDNTLVYYKDKYAIGKLFSDGYILYIENIIELVDVSKLPAIKIKTSLTQKILEDITLLIPKNQLIGKVADNIKEASDYIRSVNLKNIFINEDDENNSAVTLEILFEDAANKLSRDQIEEIKEKLLNNIKKFHAVLKK